MQTKIMSIFARTPLHVGCGSSIGAVDQPVVRERHTGYPVIPGSSIKGVLADLWNGDPDSVKRVETEKDGKNSVPLVRVKNGEAYELFGNDAAAKEASAGAILIGEGKLVAFPVRSAKGCWAWLTCPLVLGRLARDWRTRDGDPAPAPLGAPAVAKNGGGEDLGAPAVAKNGGAGAEPPSLVQPKEGEALAGDALVLAGCGEKSAVFEEYPLKVSGAVPESVVAWLKPLSDDPVWADNLAGHLAIVDDDLFAYFAKNACEIANHNRINDETGVVEGGALFSQENVPSETLFYAPVGCDEAKCKDGLGKLLSKVAAQGNKLQVGADATTGLGWCSVTFKDAK